MMKQGLALVVCVMLALCAGCKKEEDANSSANNAEQAAGGAQAADGERAADDGAQAADDGAQADGEHAADDGEQAADDGEQAADDGEQAQEGVSPAIAMGCDGYLSAVKTTCMQRLKKNATPFSCKSELMEADTVREMLAGEGVPEIIASRGEAAVKSFVDSYCDRQARGVARSLAELSSAAEVSWGPECSSAIARFEAECLAKLGTEALPSNCDTLLTLVGTIISQNGGDITAEPVERFCKEWSSAPQ